MSEKSTYYLSGKFQISRVCKKKHRTKICNRPHSVVELPVGIFWSGEWPDDLRGELIEAAKKQSKEYRKAMAKWKRRLILLENKNTAPAFKEYLARVLREHRGNAPRFVFYAPQLSETESA